MVDTLRTTKLNNSSISRTADRKNQYYSLLYSEMAERRRVEENLRRSNMILQALSNAQLQFVAGTGLAQLFSDLLRTLLEVAHAQRGYLCESAPDATTTTTPGLCIIEGLAADGDDKFFFETIAAHITHSGRTLLIHPAREMYAPELRGDGSSYYLGLPINITHVPQANVAAAGTMSCEKQVGALIIAGNADHFDPALVDLMQPVVVTSSQLIIAQRNDMRRREAEIALVNERAVLAKRVAERTAALSYSNAELARSARAKDEFLATMNHELRTPLNAVLLYADSLQLQLSGPLNERQLRAAVGIREGANHLLLLINDILDLAKIDAGKLNLDIKPTMAETLCAGTLRLVAEMAHKKKLQLHYDRAAEVDQIDVDERRVKQMVVNLLSNAVKFTPEGGEVGLEVRGDAENNVVHFSVWDTGIGISQADLKKLFQPFVQLDSGHLRQQGGTGLGLFLVYRMAELHGGSVTVSSQIEQGSRFTITVPWHQQHQVLDLNTLAAPPELCCANDHAAAVATYKVLIADDNESNLCVLTDLLETWHCQIHVARTGLQAVKHAKEFRPHLVLMDIQMPEMNGLEAIRAIRAEPGLQQLPIVALTALAMPGDREQCLAAGADDYLSKPIQIARLTNVLNRHLKCLPLQEKP